jgi:predicted metal-dependent hydrolase
MKPYPEAYTDYLLYFHAQRDYFECHEVMEEFWKEHPGDERSRTYVALIQIAVGMYHIRRGNRTGAVKMLQSAERNAQAAHVSSLGMDAQKLQELIHQTWSQIERDDYRYEDIDLPINDQELTALCLDECKRRGLTWQMPSPMADELLIQKHTRRDRSDVIEERARQQQIRKEKGGAK